MEAEVFGIADQACMEAALAVRWAVFVDEQHVPAEEEIDEHDRSDELARHAIVRAAGVIAAGRYYRAADGAAQIGRMAVLAAHRGRGAGRLLLETLMADARRSGYARASLNAQVHALRFYERAGFTPVGPRFEECAIAHQAMQRTL